MKATLIALAVVIGASTASAYASTPDSAVIQQANAQQALQSQSVRNVAQGKTRAEVRHELDLARKDGELAALNKFYQGS